MKCCQSGFPSFKGISHQQRQRLFCVAVGEWLWLLPHSQGTPEFSSLQPLSAPSGCRRGFFVCFLQGCRRSKTAVSTMVCRDTSFYMNECKDTGLCISAHWARKPLPQRCSWPCVLPAQSSLKTTKQMLNLCWEFITKWSPWVQ